MSAPGVLGALVRAGLGTGAAVEVELIGNREPVTRVGGPLIEAALGPDGATVEALAIGLPGGAVSVIPWHAVSRVIIRPTHPAL